MSDQARDELLPEECLASGGPSEDNGKDDNESTNVLSKISGLEITSSDWKDNQHNNHLSITSRSDTDTSSSKVKLINAENKSVNLPEKHINTAGKHINDPVTKDIASGKRENQHNNHLSITSCSDTDKSSSIDKHINAEKKAVNFHKHINTSGKYSNDPGKTPIKEKEINNTNESTTDLSRGEIDNQQNEILSKVVPYGIDTLATSEVVPDHDSYDTPTISDEKDTPLFDDDRYPGKAKEDDQATIHLKLKTACKHGSFHLLKKTLAEHYMKLTPDEQGRTCLFEACLAGRHDMVKFLVDYGFDENHQDNEGKTPLHVAAENQLWGIYDFLLDEFKANFKLRDSRNWTPYHHAMDWCHESTNVKLFIKEFLEKDLGTDVSWLHLHAACWANQLQTVKLLIQHKVDVKRVSSYGITALFIASVKNNDAICDCLIEHGANLNIVYTEGHHKSTVLLHAIGKGYTSIAMRLIEKGADVNIPDDHSKTALHYAVEHNQLDVMRELLNHGADINSSNLARHTAVHWAAANEMDEPLKLLLEYRPEIHRRNVFGNTALHMAADRACTNNVILLLQHGADPLITNSEGHTPFDMAVGVHEQDPETSKAFIQYTTSIIDTVSSTNKMTALHFFCCKGNTDMVKYLLDMGASKDVICSKGYLPIDGAFHYEHINIVEMLIDAGTNATLATSEMPFTFLERIYIQRHDHMSLLQRVFASEKCVMDLTRRNTKGETFMHQACRDGADKVIHMMLVSKRAEIGLNICDNDGKSPVAILCEQASRLRMNAVYSISMMAECVGRKLDVDTVDSEMKTPLHRACEADCIFIVNILLDVYHVSPNARDAMGKTPIQYVGPTGNQDIVKLLREFGAETD